MSEIVLDVKALPEILLDMITTKQVRITQTNGIISLIPIREVADDECPLLGIASGSSLTVEKFLAMTREDYAHEGLRK